jgi:ferredoxin-NADP reductase
VYSRPAASDQVGADFDAPGHIDTALLRKVGVSQGSDFYLCGPSSFLQNMRDGLGNWGVLAENVHKEIFGSLEAITPGMAQVDHTLIYPKGRPDLSPRSHSRVAGLPPLGIRNLGACLNWRKRVMFRSDGRAGVESVTPA